MANLTRNLVMQCKFFCVDRSYKESTSKDMKMTLSFPYKESTSKDMNNDDDLNLHSMTKLLG